MAADLKQTGLGVPLLLEVDLPLGVNTDEGLCQKRLQFEYVFLSDDPVECYASGELQVLCQWLRSGLELVRLRVGCNLKGLPLNFHQFLLIFLLSFRFLNLGSLVPLLGCKNAHGPGQLGSLQHVCALS